MIRIYDQPNHKHYGPVRRLHIMVMQLFGDRDLDPIEATYREWHLAPWDHDLSWLLDFGDREARAQRTVLRQLLACL